MNLEGVTEICQNTDIYGIMEWKPIFSLEKCTTIWRFFNLRALQIMTHTPVLLWVDDLTFLDKGALETLKLVRKSWPLEESKGIYIHPEYRKKCKDLQPAHYRSKQNRVVLYCDRLSLKVWLWCRSEDKAPYRNRLVRFPKKPTSEQGGKCVGCKHLTIFSITPPVRCWKPILKLFGFEMPLYNGHKSES